MRSTETTSAASSRGRPRCSRSPCPTSSTSSVAVQPSVSAMSATMYGCDIVWPAAMRQRRVVVGVVTRCSQERTASRGHPLHRGEHALVGDVPGRAAARQPSCAEPRRSARQATRAAAAASTPRRRATKGAMSTMRGAAGRPRPRASAPPSRPRPVSRGCRRRRAGGRRCPRTRSPRPPWRAPRRRVGWRAPPRRARGRSGRRSSVPSPVNLPFPIAVGAEPQLLAVASDDGLLARRVEDARRRPDRARGARRARRRRVRAPRRR